ncbi:MAG: D-alanyl-D-alanine carboxypeptidase family protein [Brevundimonas sp.]|uniref:D-alanyl-D-alanine carboxypeptidase family protein n=1 Tax=Brevundimonas sp. TaxID=1871086 RepID=UPI0025B9B713|nr:D-alanyl-D-alanine carboxypeptidase family protein [Brevundimonas sp.]MBX3476552.1 D-alanyl-D-alanine carboxypeptidase family protein [Brevundimonas sp.]
MRALWPMLSLLIALLASPVAAQTRDPCQAGDDRWAGQAFANAISVYSLEWSPFGAQEWGWETYLPLVHKELGTACAPTTPVFAEALSRLQARYNLPATGVFDQDTFQVLRGVWQERRPFIMARVNGGPCPDPPPLSSLGYLVAEEEHADRLTRLLRRDVLAAYRRMVAAARAEVPEIAADPELLQIFSGFRDPEADAARCAQQGNCDGVRRAVCSPHRTGTAVDLYVGQIEGLGVDSTVPASRRHMSQGAAYRWLVANAGRFGFVPYVFEPWHWEWVGEAAPQGHP